MEIFKGYVVTNGKVPIKGNYLKEPQPFDEVKDHESYAGVLADNVVLVDVDDESAGKALFQMCEILQWKTIVRKTTRGYHFFFKTIKGLDNHTNQATPLGINIDTKVGGKGIAVLKLNGTERPIVYGKDVKDIMEIPKILIPNHKLHTLFGMREGGRNSALYSNIIPLKQSGWSLSDIQNLYKVINECILGEPLSEEELGTITRKEAYDGAEHGEREQRLGNGALMRIYEDFVNTYHPRKVFDRIYIYTDEGWVGGDKVVRGAMLKIENKLSMAQRTEILTRLDDTLQIEEYDPPTNYVWLKNGVLDTTTLKLYPHSSDYFLINRIDYDWIPDAYDKNMDDFLTSVSDDDVEVRALLEEMIGLCLTPSTEFQKAFVLIGDQNNGKSTYLKAMGKLLGKDNVSALDLKDIDKQFRTSGIFGKTANIGDDISDNWIDELSTFKKIVTGDRITIEFKNKDAFNMTPSCKLIFSANTMPNFRDPTGAVMRRLCIIPFTRQYGEKYPKDPKMGEKITTDSAMEYLLRLAVMGLKRLWDNGDFTECQASIEAVKHYEFDVNPLYAFLQSCPMTQIIGYPREDVYSKYVTWANLYNYKPLNVSNFTKQLVLSVKGLTTQSDGKGIIRFKNNMED